MTPDLEAVLDPSEEALIRLRSQRKPEKALRTLFREIDRLRAELECWKDEAELWKAVAKEREEA